MADDMTSPKINPVQYAEEVLGVHVPWAEAEERLQEHGEISTVLSEIKAKVRITKVEVEDRKQVVVAEAPSMDGWPATGVQAQRDFIKKCIAEDAKIRELERRLDDFQSQVDSLHGIQKHHEIGLSVLSARMSELGGLLQFYAAVKQAETAAQENTSNLSTQVHESESTHD